MLRTGFCLTLRHIASRNGIPTSSITACSDLRPVIATANTEVLAGPAISTFLRQYSSSETASRKKPNSSRNAAWNNPKIDPKAGSPKTLLQSWLSLDPKVRIKFGLAVAAFAICGLIISDALEDYMNDEKVSSPKETTEFS